MSSTGPSAPPRTLADQLRGWPDKRLAGLLSARPDLASPAPQDSSQLASRASTRASVLRALDQLDRLELTVLDALVVLGGRAPTQRVAELVHAAPGRVTTALRRLADLALVWGAEDDLRTVTAVVDTLGTTVSGLGPPIEQLLSGAGPERVAALLTDLGAESTGDRAADVRRVTELLSDPSVVAGLVQACDPAARSMLDHLERTGAGGVSEHARRPARTATATAPVEQLVARGLLLAKDARHLVVPREVGLALREGRTTRDDVGVPPPLVLAERASRLVNQAAAGAAYELVHRVELLLDHWGNQPPAGLRQGGLAVRDLKATAQLLHGDERTAGLVVEIAAAAGLVAQGSSEDHDVAWLPTDGFDAWRGQSLARRWTRLAEAWLENPRLTGLVGGRFQGRPVNALAPDLERTWAPASRREALGQVAEVDAGQVLAAGTGVPSLVARLQWLRPRRPAARGEAVAWTVAEAAVVGVLGLGGLSTHGRALLLEGDEAAAAALEPLLPRPVDHVLLQADLTAVAPGPLEEPLARDLATVARVESRGGATVYRFSEASIRHAFDVGWSAVEVRDAITRAARTEVPQALDYLIDDVARTFGTVRLGTAETYLRSDDEAALAALVHDPRAADLGLRRIAPTVLVSSEPADELLPRLRELGVAPVVEGADGLVRLGRREVHRTRAPRSPHPGPQGPARAAAHVAATVTAIRAGDRAAETQPAARTSAQQSPASALAVLREAAESSRTVCIGYVDRDGSSHERVVDPERVDGGWLRAFDHRTDEVRSFAIHRISSVRAV